MSTTIRYLRGEDVSAAMPPLAERLDLAERALTALVGDAEMPPKTAVHSRPIRSFSHAMPAALKPAGAGSATDGDLLGLKWVSGFPTNRGTDVPRINALVVLSDAATGVPTAILDGGPITALRTAAVSGVAIRHFGPVGATAPVAAVIGAGVQGHSHVEMLGGVLPGVRILVHDRHPERAAALATHAATLPGVAGVDVVDTAWDATSAADVVITVASFAAPEHRQSMTPDRLKRDALVVAVDYAAMCAASTARAAALFLTDDRGQFLVNRDAGNFDDYPDPGATMGEAILARTPRPDGLVVATHLGIGLADLVFADAIVQRAVTAGRGMVLPR
jgi:ornithine cyclodeaminase/alanine dehydrogenase-like protein (mu-crystallin family)